MVETEGGRRERRGRKEMRRKRETKVRKLLQPQMQDN